MTKQLVAPPLCERAPLVCPDPCSPLITLLRPHVTAATGVATSLCPGCNGDERKSWRGIQLILAWVGLDVSVFFFSFIATPNPAHRRWGPSPRSGLMWSKANRWAWIVPRLPGCQWPLARSKNLWGELKHPQVAASRGLSLNLIWPGSSAHWGAGQRMMLQENNLQPMTSQVNPLLPIAPCRMVLNNGVKSNMTYSPKKKPALLSDFSLPSLLLCQFSRLCLRVHSEVNHKNARQGNNPTV